MRSQPGSRRGRGGAGRRSSALVGALVSMLVVIGSGCADGDDHQGAGPGDPAVLTAPEGMTSPTASLPPVDGPFTPGRTRIPGFGEVEVRIVPGPDGEPVVLCVLVADSPEQRGRGLMGVADPELGGYDGMLFRFPAESTTGFYMKDTLLPLSIAYLDAEGATVDVRDMEPCTEHDGACPTYPPSGPYRMALEVLQGGLDDLGLAPGSAARLEVGGACRPPPG